MTNFLCMLNLPNGVDIFMLIYYCARVFFICLLLLILSLINSHLWVFNLDRRIPQSTKMSFLASQTISYILGMKQL